MKTLQHLLEPIKIGALELSNRLVMPPMGTGLADMGGIVSEANLIVATVGNAAAINMSIETAAKAFIKGGKVTDGLLNMAEMGFRAYDPCHACGTHALPGNMPLVIEVMDRQGSLVRRLKR